MLNYCPHCGNKLPTARALAAAPAPLEDRYEQSVLLWLKLHSKTDCSVTEVLSGAIKRPGPWTTFERMRVGKVLRRAGWSKYRTTKPAREWRYRLPSEAS